MFVKVENKSVVCRIDQDGTIWYLRKADLKNSSYSIWTLRFNEAKTFDSLKDWKKVMSLVFDLVDQYDDPSSILLLDVNMKGCTINELNYIDPDEDCEDE